MKMPDIQAENTTCYEHGVEQKGLIIKSLYNHGSELQLSFCSAVFFFQRSFSYTDNLSDDCCCGLQRLNHDVMEKKGRTSIHPLAKYLGHRQYSNFQII